MSKTRESQFVAIFLHIRLLMAIDTSPYTTFRKTAKNCSLIFDYIGYFQRMFRSNG